MTRGPWHLGCEGSHVADVSGVEVSAPDLPRMHRPDEEERAANARLIAAAPDLYKALKDWLEFVDGYNPDRECDDGCECVGCFARSVIARVEGKVSV